MKNVKSVRIVFENCDCFEIESKFFGVFELEKIEQSICRIACNSISKIQTANRVVFEIFSEANKEYSVFGGSEKQLKLNRILAWKDITQIIVIYEDNSSETYYVDYDDDGNTGLGAENKNQKSHISSFGNLYLVIEKDKDVFDFFDKEDIENYNLTEFSKDMIMR